ncbi:hypothetical protein A9Q99_15695 [Gammaproteobacteria bacterium 45_16_T64]|nr:hypothetical protein A9Q99_15695 [Gammaproteobacteria bacterium 45_16_T64]
MNKPIALIVGVGDRKGIGAAISAKAASEGMHVVMVGRTQQKLKLVSDEIKAAGGASSVVIADCTKQSNVKEIFTQVSNLNADLRLVVYNTGRNMPAPFLEHSTRIIEDHWKRCVKGGTLVGQGSVRTMLNNNADNGHRGTIIYTGASASLRGKPLFSGFSAAKAGIRAIAQSMSKEFSPQGINVANVIVDGVVDGGLVKSVGSLGHYLIKSKGKDGALLPDEVAKAYWMIHSEYPHTVISELDVRPFKEVF